MTSADKLRILVVDDEKLLRWSLDEHLQRIGYDVASAETGELAVQAARERTPDLLLLDVRLPGIDGLEVLRQCLTIDPNVAAIMMSAHASVDCAVEAMKLGAVDFLVKPFQFKELDVCIERALALKQMGDQVERLAARSPDGDSALSAIVGSSPAIEETRAMVARLAARDTGTVLIDGESGAGKEVIARAIHFHSPRASKPFCQINCAAVPDQLLESELFGHERGAFTGAFEQKRGLFESVEDGTIMLDEIGEMPPQGQAKLLLLLGNRTFRRVGGTTELHSRARVIGATNVDLEESVRRGEFRADLYHRLNVISIHVPPLRARASDIPLLAAHFIARLKDELDSKMHTVSGPALDIMQRYDWPGNVRELRNVVERALILNPNATELRPEHLPPRLQSATLTSAASPSATPAAISAADSQPVKLEHMEHQLIVDALERNRGNQSQAARELGISRDALRYRMKKHGLL